MCRLIESIKLLDGKFHNLSYHEERMMSSLRKLFGHNELIDLQVYLNSKRFPRKGFYKSRIVYDHRTMEIEFTPYVARPVQNLKVIEDDGIEYDLKLADRSAIDRLFQRRGRCDDILIVRNGRVTDSSISNVVFRKGSDWFTPRSPLLKGTMRQNLLDQKNIREEEISKKDIRSFETFKTINAMLEFDSPEIEVSNIVF
jgi:4-amino-4-deoxychorismate lyase